jgi:hypothetical protein
MAWVATDSHTKRIIGAAAAFPRSVYVNGRKACGYVLGDFCIDSAHRYLGLAVSLQRACLDGLSAANAALALDFPSRSMLAVYNRMDIRPNESVVRYVKPLRADRQIERHVPVRPLARGFTALVNAGLRVRDCASVRRKQWTISPEAGPWSEEFTHATAQWTPAAGISVSRTAEYLNWRYREHPQQQYEMLVARLKGRLCGYLVRHVNGDVCIIDDLLGQDDAVSKALLMEAIVLARSENLHAVNAPWPCNDSGGRLLGECGFLQRESSPVVLLPIETQLCSSAVQPSIRFHLSHGDWEI